MRRSITMAFALAVAALVTAVPAHAQRWGRGATPRSGVCFYQDINFGGRYFCADAGTSTRSWPQQVVDNNWTQRDLEYALRQSDEYRQLRSTRRR